MWWEKRTERAGGRGVGENNGNQNWSSETCEGKDHAGIVALEWSRGAVDPRARSGVLDGLLMWTWTCPRMLASTSTEKTENDLPVVAEGSLADRCVVVWLRGAPKRRFRVGCWNDAWRLAEHRHCLPVWQGPLRGHGFHPRRGQARPQQRAVWHWTSS